MKAFNCVMVYFNHVNRKHEFNNKNTERAKSIESKYQILDNVDVYNFEHGTNCNLICTFSDKEKEK